MPFIGGAIAGAAVGALQTGVGIYQLFKGNKLAKENKRPTYEIPEQIKQQLSTAEILALEGLPEEQRNIAIDDLMRSATMSISASNDRRGGLSNISAIQQNVNDAQRNILAMDAQARMNNTQMLQNVRSNYANYVDKQFQLNKMQPFMEKAQAAQAMKGAGLQNIMGGIQGSVQNITNGITNNAYMDMYAKMASSNVGANGLQGQTNPSLQQSNNNTISSPLLYQNNYPTYESVIPPMYSNGMIDIANSQQGYGMMNPYIQYQQVPPNQ